METKVCKQCGKLKPIENFRHYYGGRTGTYRTCLDCERINTREKYLRRKVSDDRASADEQTELQHIHALYAMQRHAGLQPPRVRNTVSSVSGMVDQLINEYATQEKAAIEQLMNGDIVLPSDNVPEELAMWLTTELTEEPEYYQDEVYEKLREKFRPVKEIDTTTLMPVYDDTYRMVLDRILARFDAYEDKYYELYDSKTDSVRND